MSENIQSSSENFTNENSNTNSVQDASMTKYWLTLEQWSQDPEFEKIASQEFMSSPLRESETKELEGEEGGWARREFLKLMSASLALGSAGCLRRPVEKIVPYNKQPEEVTFAQANYYTSVYSDGFETIPLLVKTKEGRPLKIEGNDKFSLTGGGTSVRAQAHILSLYDPERFREPKKNLLNKDRTNRDTISYKWEDLDKEISEKLSQGGVALLTAETQSPSLRALYSDFSQGFGGQHYIYDSLSTSSLVEGMKSSFGQAVVPDYKLDKAKVIISIDTDILGTWLNPTRFNAQFGAARKDIEKMNQLVVFESGYSLTGANADLRFKIKPSQQVAVVMGLISEVLKKGKTKFANDSAIKAQADSFSSVWDELKIDKELVSKVVDELTNHLGKSIVFAGGLQTETTQARELQVAVNFLNFILDNVNNTIHLGSGVKAIGAQTSSDLLAAIKAGKVKTLVIRKCNPGYSASAELIEAIKSVATVVYLGDRNDETGQLSHYVVTENHDLETWSDAQLFGGYFAIHQPTIRPMYDTRSGQLSLMTWAFMAKKGSARITGPETYYDYVRNYWKADIYPSLSSGKSFEDFWEDLLQVGFVGGSAKDITVNFNTSALSQIKKTPGSDLELVMYPKISLGDGSLANVSWLQELPDPVTKICWDNYASVSLANAKKWNLKEGSVVELDLVHQKMELPVHIQPGLSDDVVAVAVGYGRTAAGKVANGVGFNTYKLVNHQNAQAVFSGQSAKLTKTSKNYELANPQGHHYLGDEKTAGRKIVVEATLSEYVKDKAANNHNHKIWSLWPQHQYNGHKWGMAVDLNSCTGCNACVVACQSENNIPVVGKKYVIQGREMHWIRVDRYFVGDPANAEAVFQPLMCQHCDNAPCETVCPVAATVHSDEGTNDMIYNRCVGTRYCANNCPYKVRRFNWFNYLKDLEKPLNMAYNPSVTVRPRGVMEKCTFCIHKIKEGKNKAKLAGKKLQDGDIKTACQAACPTKAITFGDLNNPESEVAKMYKDDPRGYALLEEFHAAPNVRYFTKVRNNFSEKRYAHDGHGSGHKEGGH